MAKLNVYLDTIGLQISFHIANSSPPGSNTCGVCGVTLRASTLGLNRAMDVHQLWEAPRNNPGNGLSRCSQPYEH